MPLAALVALLRNHPLAASATGATSGLLTWIVSWGEHFSLLFRLVGGLFGALMTVACFLLLLPRLVRFLRRWRAKGLAHADGDEPFTPGGS